MGRKKKEEERQVLWTKNKGGNEFGVNSGVNLVVRVGKRSRWGREGDVLLRAVLV